MKKSTFLALSFAILGLASTSVAAPVTYQATGPVTEVTETKIVIQKGKETWEIARTPETKITGEIKVGSKITVMYTMTAATVEVKSEKEKAKDEKPKAPEKKPAPEAAKPSKKAA